MNLQSTVICVALVAALSVLVMAQQQQQKSCQDIQGMPSLNASRVSNANA